MAIAQYRQVDFIEAHFKPDELRVAGPGRRLAGALLDYLFVVPAQFALWIALFWSLVASVDSSESGNAGAMWVIAGGLSFAWLAWFCYAAMNGQSPGKQLLGMYVLKADGTRAGGGYMILRELVVKHFLTTVLSWLTFGIYWFLAALWCLWDRDNQCLWDKMASTFVAWSPNGYKPATANEAAGGTVPSSPASPARRAAPVVAVSPAPGLVFAPAATGRVSVFDGDRDLGTFAVTSGRPLTVGRAEDADIRLTDPRVSRKHVQLELNGAGWLVKDLGSTNPARIIAPAPEREVPMSETVPYGQLAVGNSVLTLYPLT